MPRCAVVWGREKLSHHITSLHSSLPDRFYLVFRGGKGWAAWDENLFGWGGKFTDGCRKKIFTSGKILLGEEIEITNHNPGRSSSLGSRLCDKSEACENYLTRAEVGWAARRSNNPAVRPSIHLQLISSSLFIHSYSSPGTLLLFQSKGLRRSCSIVWIFYCFWMTLEMFSSVWMKSLACKLQNGRTSDKFVKL